MYGRNGMDLCNNIILIFLFISLLVAVLAPNLIVAYVAIGFSLIFFLFFMYRTFSKDLAQRRKENEFFCRIQRSIQAEIRLLKNKWRDRKTHIYKKCPKCKNVLRLKRIKGTHTCICPRCNEKIEVKIKRDYNKADKKTKEKKSKETKSE